MKQRILVLVVCSLILGGLPGFLVCSAEGVCVEPLDAQFLNEIEEATYKGLGELLTDPRTGLPFDIFDVEMMEVLDPKTSPTNIGLLIASIVAARDREMICEIEARERLGRIVDTLEKMEKYETPIESASPAEESANEIHRYFYNWYDLANLDENGAPTPGAPTVGAEAQRFVSFVDNSNLVVGMMVAVQAFQSTGLATRFEALVESIDFNFFYRKNPHDQNARLMNHGFHADTGEFSPYDYGVLNTEARLGVLISILKDGVPLDAWRTMRTIHTVYETAKGEAIIAMKSWGGDLFEHLFPDLFVNEAKYAPTSFGENNRRAVLIHIEAAKKHGLPIWGWSPSETSSGRYSAAGVPELGESGYPLNQVSPYSVLLALRYAPKEAIESLKRMIELNEQVYNKKFGFRDSIDPNTGVVCPDLLSLDKAMEAIALHNFLMELEDKEGVWSYFWSYLDSIQKDEEGKRLLEGVEFSFEDFHTELP